MDIGEVLFCETRNEWRAWLAQHHSARTEIWLANYKKGSGKRSVDYDSALDEAVCFGWVDGLIKRVDDQYYVMRWSPRRRRSNWTEGNRDRARRLMADGLMTPSGIDALPPDLRAEFSPSGDV